MFKEEREGYIGNPQQLVTLRKRTEAEGRAKGTQVIEVCTAAGLSLDILPDAGLDIGQARFKGINMSWMCKNGYDSPSAINPYETEFVNTFPGGLLYTCGLRSAGPANRDDGEWHPLHGRYHGLQAEQVCAEIIGDEIIIKGVVRESALFGHLLELRRTIRIPCFGAEIQIEDEITNKMPRDEEYMQIYHCNFGYPLIAEDAVLELPEERETIPRTPFAATLLGREQGFEKPVPGEEERVFFHKIKNDFTAVLKNPKLGIKMKMAWSGGTLPILGHWRSMAAGDYVLGIEPTNCFIKGRHEERENGTLKTIKAYETIKNKVTISFENC